MQNIQHVFTLKELIIKLEIIAFIKMQTIGKHRDNKKYVKRMTIHRSRIFKLLIDISKIVKFRTFQK